MLPGSAWQGHLMDVAFLVLILEGAHLNPAFSLAMCLLGRLPWAKLPIYSLVQLLSAFCASGATYALYYGNRGWRWGPLRAGGSPQGTAPGTPPCGREPWSRLE